MNVICVAITARETSRHFFIWMRTVRQIVDCVGPKAMANGGYIDSKFSKAKSEIVLSPIRRRCRVDLPHLGVVDYLKRVNFITYIYQKLYKNDKNKSAKTWACYMHFTVIVRVWLYWMLIPATFGKSWQGSTRLVIMVVSVVPVSNSTSVSID